MDESPTNPPEPAPLVSVVADLSDTPLADLVGDAAPQAAAALDRVLDVQRHGLLSVASFNATI